MADRIAALMNLGGQDGAYVIYKPENVRHFSDFAGEGMLVIAQGLRVIVTDFRYDEQAKIESPGWDVSLISRGVTHEARIAEALAAVSGKIRAEFDYLTVDTFDKLKAALKGREIVPLDKLPEKLREIKEPKEIELIAKAAAITDMAFDHILGIIKPGVTEREIALELYTNMMKDGADDAAFPIIVASGPNGSLPHAVPSERKVQAGDLVTMDYGALYGGYCSDFTRTVAVGAVDAEFRKIYDITLTAQLMALDALVAGKTGQAIDAVARDHIAAAGYGEFFGHGLGHALGRLIHESPRLSVANEDPLPAGTVMTVEPGIYLAGEYGCRIEDMVLITEAGCTPMPKSPKGLIVL